MSLVSSSRWRFSRYVSALPVSEMSFLSFRSFVRKPRQINFCLVLSRVSYVITTDMRDKKASSICPIRFVVCADELDHEGIRFLAGMVY